MKSSGIQATTVRGLMITIIIVVVLLAGIAFYFIQAWLHTYAISVGQTIATAGSSGSNVDALKKLQTQITERQSILTKAEAITVSSSNYQIQAVNDLGIYAADAGITITNYGLAQAATNTTSTTPTPATTTGNAYITLTVTSPMSYTKLLTFMGLVEGNLPKMEVSSITLQQVTSGDPDSIQVSNLVVEVFTQ